MNVECKDRITRNLGIISRRKSGFSLDLPKWLKGKILEARDNGLDVLVYGRHVNDAYSAFSPLVKTEHIRFEHSGSYQGNFVTQPYAEIPHAVDFANEVSRLLDIRVVAVDSDSPWNTGYCDWHPSTVWIEWSKD